MTSARTRAVDTVRYTLITLQNLKYGAETVTSHSLSYVCGNCNFGSDLPQLKR